MSQRSASVFLQMSNILIHPVIISGVLQLTAILDMPLCIARASEDAAMRQKAGSDSVFFVYI